MNIAFTFKNFEPSNHLRQYAERRFGKLKRFLSKSGNVEVAVVLSVDKFRHKIDIRLVGDGINLSAVEETDDMYATIDLVLDKILTQVKRHSEHARSKKQRQQAEGRAIKMDVFNFTMEQTGGERTIVGEDKFEPKPLYSDEAAMQLEHRDEEFLVFLNAETDHVNVIYRRKNGAFGLIDLGIKE